MALVNEFESQKVRFKGAVENNFLKNILILVGLSLRHYGHLGWFFLFRKVGGMGSPFMSFGKAKDKTVLEQRDTKDNKNVCRV